MKNYNKINTNSNNICFGNNYNNNTNSRYPDVNKNPEYNKSHITNNSSINMNSIKNKDLKMDTNSNKNKFSLKFNPDIINQNNFNNEITFTDSSEHNVVNYNKTKTYPFSIGQASICNNPNKKEFYSVNEFAFREEINSKYKNNMEDYTKILDKFNENKKMGFFSLFDGHGGEDPVKYVKERMPEILGKLIKNSNNTIDECLISAFEKVDNELKFYDSENNGTTATVVVINDKYIYSANVGDSKSILVNITNNINSNENINDDINWTIDNIKIKQLSCDHKCNDESEIKRIKNSGGMIFNDRVFGQLAITRALGDHAIKKYGVISTPFVSITEIKKNDKFIIIASDGVWDVT